MNKRILVVEDDVAIANLIKMTLATQQYEFDIAQDGNRALQKAITMKPDVYILDLGLPDIDGVELITKLEAGLKRPLLSSVPAGKNMIRLTPWMQVQMIMSRSHSVWKNY